MIRDHRQCEHELTRVWVALCRLSVARNIPDSWTVVVVQLGRYRRQLTLETIPPAIQYSSRVKLPFREFTSKRMVAASLRRRL